VVARVTAAALPRAGGLIFDKNKRIAIVRTVEVRGCKVLRSMTFDAGPARR